MVGPGDLASPEQRAEVESPKPAFAPGEEPRPRDGEPTGSAHGELL
jgi:hypothetical protein